MRWKVNVTAVRIIAISFFIVLCSSNIYAVPFGRLDINYSIVASMDSDTCKVLQYITGEEGFDGSDNIYGPLFSPYGVKSKIVSIIPSYELAADVRPRGSKSPIYLELSIHRQNGNPTTISASNYLSFELFEYDSGSQWVNENFGTLPITLQQYDPCDANACYPEYDVRKVINLEGGIITLPDLDGTYNSEEVYAWFKLSFDKYHTDLNGDQKNDFEDFAIFANAWQRTGITLTDRENPVDLEAYADYDLDGAVDTNDLCIFTGRWLWDANDPNTW